ncbi:DUF2125 domain-containing protein [Arenibacterium sp. CAU 1754]
MAFRLARTGAAALLCVFSAQTALADLSARDVWADWKAYLGASGYDVSANEQMSGDTLTINDMVMEMILADENGGLSIDIPTFSLVQNDDGSVDVVFPNRIPMQLAFATVQESINSAEILLSHENLALRVTGDPTNMIYTQTADRMSATVGALTRDGQPVSPEDFDMNVSMTDVAGSTVMKRGDLRAIDQDMTAGSLTYDIAYNDPATDDQGTFKGALQGIKMRGMSMIPLQMDPNDLSASLENGLTAKGTLTYTAGNGTIEGTGDGQAFSMTSSSQGGEFSFAMDKTEGGYDLSGRDTSITLTTEALPFPVSLNMARSALKVAVPTMKSDDPQDFAFGLTLGEFTMSDMIWGMFDPTGQLPRDPATVQLDLTGKARMKASLFDPKDADIVAMSDVMPGELNALTIHGFLVSLVGARLSGTGDFTFDNSDTETFDGMPKPTGAMDLKLVGANGLIDRLIAMGIVGDQEAMGARMMMGMFGVPGSEPDTLNSKLEINEQGHVLANGQRIQ